MRVLLSFLIITMYSFTIGITIYAIPIPDELAPLTNTSEFAERKVAYLTFDDGPSQNTIPILDILDKYHTKATFFVMANRQSYAKHAYEEMIKRGHTIALHSNTHDYRVIYRSKEDFFKDMGKLESLLDHQYSINTKLIRFPGGSNNMLIQRYDKKSIRTDIISELEKRGYTYFDWNVDSKDGISPMISQQTITQSVLKGAKKHKQAVILLHDIDDMKNTVKALPDIISGLKNQGFEFEMLTENNGKVQFR
ncbi:polysaccharide deacetylase family protein [Peribacillus huizhouensis]|uniref:Peptidoglycan/xylan/chitin deacetylase (PgdA/CDA1 family) n=1 Tax=Peribacillus huizhouensis TaxID=1501239 RepID=A0ABR6CSF8_9BACI|nr:polysaccharide deacetylase family protein [Peribacillus huizhouensis]MBA9027666.1 peptidoglycan/xylan/chitin deacetylase (PgdA/CDA1 family) [Peribacillus huizhouensis]